MNFTDDDKMHEARREVAMRERVYGSSPTEQQRRQLSIMRAIEADYTKRKIDGDMFGTRLNAAAVVAEVAGILRAVATPAEIQRAAERIARAMTEGK